MRDLEGRIRAAIDGMPRGGSVLLPVAWLRAALGDELDGEMRPDLSVSEFAVFVDRADSTVRGWLIEGLIPEAYHGTAGEWRIPQEAAHAARDRIRSGGFRQPPKGQTPNISAWRERDDAA